MNGTVGGRVKDNTYSPARINYGANLQDIDPSKKVNLIFQILNRHCEISEYINTHNKDGLTGIIPTILYSWEEDKLITSLRNNAKSALENQHILVIIGYSFPTFNRNIDKVILNSIITNLLLDMRNS